MHMVSMIEDEKCDKRDERTEGRNQSHPGYTSGTFPDEITSHSHNNGHSVTKKTNAIRKMLRIRTKQRGRIDSLSWTSINDITQSFLKIGIYPKASSPQDEFPSPGIKDHFVSIKKCSKCRKRKKKLHDDRSNPFMFKQTDDLRIPSNCEFTTSSLDSPTKVLLQQCDLLPKIVESYAKIIDSFDEKDGAPNKPDADLILEDINNTLQSRIFIKSPTKEYSIKVKTSKRSDDSMTMMSPYSPPSSVSNKDINPKAVEKISRVRKNIFEDRCDSCHIIMDSRKVEIKKPVAKLTKTITERPRIGNSQLENSGSLLILPPECGRDSLLKTMPVVLITKLGITRSTKLSPRNSSHVPSAKSNLMRDCSVVLKRLDNVDFKKYFCKYQKRRKFIEFLKASTKSLEASGMVTRSRMKFLL